MFRRLKYLAKRIKTDGLVSGLRWLFVTIIRRIVPHRQVIWFVDLTKITSDEFSLPHNMFVKRFRSQDEMDEDDLNTLIKCRTELMGSATNEMINKRFKNGAVLWLIKEGDCIAGYSWTIVKDPITPTYIPHSEDDVHRIGSEIFSGFRGRNLFQLLTKYMLITLKKEGFKRFYSEAYLWNKQAISAMLKTDYRKIGVAKRFSLFGRNVVIWYEMSNLKNADEYPSGEEGLGRI